MRIPSLPTTFLPSTAIYCVPTICQAPCQLLDVQWGMEQLFFTLGELRSDQEADCNKWPHVALSGGWVTCLGKPLELLGALVPASVNKPSHACTASGGGWRRRCRSAGRERCCSRCRIRAVCWDHHWGTDDGIWHGRLGHPQMSGQRCCRALRLIPSWGYARWGLEECGKNRQGGQDRDGPPRFRNSKGLASALSVRRGSMASSIAPHSLSPPEPTQLPQACEVDRAELAVHSQASGSPL